MAFDVVDEDHVYTCVGKSITLTNLTMRLIFHFLLFYYIKGHPLKSDIANVVSWMLNEDLTSAYSSKSTSTLLNVFVLT